MIQKKWLYCIVFACCVAGGSWVFLNVKGNTIQHAGKGIDVCLFHRITGLPCPSCGSTHSVLYIMHLQFGKAFYANPIGFVLAFCMIVFPIWIVYDLAAGNNTFFRFYTTSELYIRKRWVAIPLICLVAANWIWNIYKFTA